MRTKPLLIKRSGVFFVLANKPDNGKTKMANHVGRLILEVGMGVFPYLRLIRREIITN